MHALRRSAIAIAIICCLAPYAFPWNNTGHMTIAYLAYAGLDAKARRSVALLLGDDTVAAFLDAACWADEHKNGKTAPWHFSDHYFRADAGATTLEPAPENVEVEISHFAKVLGDRRSTNAAKATALRYLIHFVGDVHQPLHCASRITDDRPFGDRGGNAFKIKTPPGFNNKPRNLHALWDDGCGLFDEEHRPPSGYDDVVHVSRIAGEISRERPDVVKSDHVADWAQESFGIARSFAYTTPEGGVPSRRYLNQGRRICAFRAFAASQRLIGLLNRLLG